jgi:hypothetical protein
MPLNGMPITGETQSTGHQLLKLKSTESYGQADKKYTSIIA